jgi:HK97 family phage major capsid protein
MELQEVLKTLNDNVLAMRKSQEDGAAAYKALEQKIAALEAARVAGTVEKDVPHKDQWSWARVALAVATKNWKYAKFEEAEIEKHTDNVMKTQSTSFTAGGALIPPQYIAELVAYLRAELILERIGVRVMPGLQGSPIIIPKQTSGTTAY